MAAFHVVIHTLVLLFLFPVSSWNSARFTRSGSSFSKSSQRGAIFPLKLSESSSTQLSPNIENLGLVQRDEVFLNIFIVDCSFPGSTSRIEAVQGAVGGILRNRNERCHASVITCYHNDAEIILQPTSSLSKANRCLSNMKKSVMGNLGRGIQVALETIDQTLADGSANEIMVTIISHGKAHGLLSKTSNCLSIDLCDVDLLDAASELAAKSNVLSKQGFSLKSIVVDADPHRDAASWDDEGVRLANVLNAKYFHTPTITDEEILSSIFSSRS